MKPRPGLLVAEGFINLKDFEGTEEELEETKEELEEGEHEGEEEEYDEAMV